MEEDVSGETSFSNIDLDAPQSEYGKYLDQMCPYYLMYGMTYDEFWSESLDRLGVYWQKYQYEIEARNQELWLQGLYERAAIASILDKRSKYPEKPHRITELTEAEQEAENKRKVEQFREVLEQRRRNWQARQKGAGAS